MLCLQVFEVSVAVGMGVQIMGWGHGLVVVLQGTRL